MVKYIRSELESQQQSCGINIWKTNLQISRKSGIHDAFVLFEFSPHQQLKSTEELCLELLPLA
jgi:hypothetical protein